MFNPEWLRLKKDPTKDEGIAREFLFHDCSPEAAEWAFTTTMRLTIARQAITEVSPLTAWPDVPSTYVLCQDDLTIQPDWSRGAARERLKTEPIELPGIVLTCRDRFPLANVLASLA